MLILATLLLIIAITMMGAHFFTKKKIAALLEARRWNLKGLLEHATAQKPEVGKGCFKELVELRGVPECERTLRSPLGDALCLYYEMSISREYEEQYEEKDSEGKSRQRTRRGSEVMSTQVEHVNFELREGEEALEIRSDGASFDGLSQSIDTFEPGEAPDARFERFNLSLKSNHPMRHTLGFSYREHILPPDLPLTLIGEVKERGGRLSLGKGGLTFLISTRSKEELLGSSKSNAQLAVVGGGVSALLGIVALIASFY